jgi:hypothetical protein
MLVHGALEKARKYIESHTREAVLTKEKGEVRIAGPCITISRQAGAGSREVADILIKILELYDKKENPDWTLFDKNLINKVIEDHQLPAYLSKFLEEEKHSEIFSLMSEYLTGEPGTWSLVKKTSETIQEIAEIGNSIIIGRGANIVTAKLNNVFHVRLIALTEDRIKHVQEYYGFKRNEAIEFIENDDIARKKYLQKHFHKNIDDPLIYHLVINTSMLDYKNAAELIADAIIKKFPFRLGL